MRIHLSELSGVRGIVAFALLGFVITGCRAGPISEVAQAGSTVAITVTARDLMPNIGYGGSAAPDPQRGHIEYRLSDAVSGFPLSTRFTTVMRLSPRAELPRQGIHGGGQVMSLVDIPLDAPTGNYPVFAVHVAPDGTETPIADWQQEITILPASLSLDLDTGPTVVESSPAVIGCFPPPCASADPSLALPDPMVVVTIEPQSLWSARLRIDYPAELIDVMDAVDASTVNGDSILVDHSHPTVIWLEDDPGAGHAEIFASANTQPFRSLGLVFQLSGDSNDPNVEVLDLADVSVELLKATDEDGTPYDLASFSLTTSIR